MKTKTHHRRLASLLCAAFGCTGTAMAQIQIQCPCDRNNDGDCQDVNTNGPPASRYNEPNLAARTLKRLE